MASLFISFAFGCASLSAEVERSAGVAERTIRLALLDSTVLVDTYRLEAKDARAVVIVAHGFSRTRDTFVSLARELAGAGFAVVVPDLPQLGDHEANARFLAALGETIRSGEAPDVDFDTQRIVFAGFSAGGLATLLAAARSQDVLGWIGLDPVDRDGMAVRAASELLVPAFVVRGPPSPCNAQSNFAAAIERLPRLLADRLEADASHCDFESPTDPGCQLVCGAASSQRQRAIRAAVIDAAEAMAPR